MSEPIKNDACLSHLFQALLRLHKALLNDERLAYERVHGRIASNGALLQLVLNDAWFAWLRPLSQLMTKLDELSEGEDASTGEEMSALLACARTLLVPTEEGEGFGRQYYDALQRSPDVVLEHAAVRALLREVVPNKG
ncbi:MAG: hypothetical protein MRJ66_04980 [Nitrospira sp.]|nr:hypothetical protein [Nitrospira sp.]MDR4470446.1 hypothetical protein [Nitrospira sp.]